MKRTVKCYGVSQAQTACSWFTKFSIWWLRNFEQIIHFWTGFSWVWVIGILLASIVGIISFHGSLALIFVIGVIVHSGMYLCVKTIQAHLRDLKEGPEKELVHELMVRIIKRRIRL